MISFNVAARDFAQMKTGMMVKGEQVLNGETKVSLYKIADKAIDKGIDQDLIRAELPVIPIDSSKPTIDMAVDKIGLNIIPPISKDVPEGGKLYLLG